MKTMIENVLILDLRKATRESIEQIERIENVAVAFVSPATKALLPLLVIENLASVVETGEDVETSVHNGEYTLSEVRTDAPVFLLVNGMLTIAPDLSPDAITKGLAGALVNGLVRANASQMAALTNVGLQINGSTMQYPDGSRLRGDHTPLEEAEVLAAQQPLYLARRTNVSSGAIRALAAQGLPLYGSKGAIIDAADAEAFFRVWQGSGDVIQVPTGFKAMYGTQTIGKREALLLRGKRYIVGDLMLRSDVRAAQLSGLEALSVTGRVFVPEGLLEFLLGVLDGEPELIPYEGELIMMSGVQTIGEDLSLLPDRTAVYIKGVLEISPSTSPEALKERVSLLYVEGVVRMSWAQQMALLPVLIDNGHVDVSDGKDGEEKPADRSNMQFIENATTFIL